MAKGSASWSSRLVVDMISCRRCCARAFCSGAKIKPIPPPDMPPSIQKPQKSSPNSARTRAISVSGEELVAQGVIDCIGLWEVGGGGRPVSARGAATQGGEYLIECAQHALARFPFRVAAQQVFLGDHFKDGPDILRHAAVDEDEAVLEIGRASCRERV